MSVITERTLKEGNAVFLLIPPSLSPCEAFVMGFFGWVIDWLDPYYCGLIG